jgi:hypothetical protein
MTVPRSEPRVLAVLPSYMSARQLLLTPAGRTLANTAQVTCVMNATTLQRIGPAISSLPLRVMTVPEDDRRPARLMIRGVQRLLPGAGYAGLAYRFNELNGFTGHQFKKTLPPETYAREARAGNYVDPVLGWPFPRSARAYRVLTNLYWMDRLLNRNILAQFAEIRPDVAYIGQMQIPRTREFVLSLRRLGIPTVGNVMSWDHPHLKGPLPPGLDRYTVQTNWMADMVVRYHGVSPDKVVVTGWPTMDHYATPMDPEVLRKTRERLGIPPGARVVLFGLTSPRLGSDEPSIVRHLLDWMETTADGPWHLVIRPHPEKRQFLDAFDFIDGNPRVTMAADALDDIEFQKAQIVIADVVALSIGSLALDAIAAGRPVVWVSGSKAVDLSLMEHLADVAGINAIPIVEGHHDLIAEIKQAASQKERLAQERQRLIDRHLGPLDGQSGARLVQAILGQAAPAGRTGPAVDGATDGMAAGD